ncbi:MAG: hypothetical protein WD572_03645 [Gammaproteobacteria bacterium]
MERFYVSTKWTKKHWAATLLLVSAFACLAFYGKDDELLIRQLTGAYFGYALCMAMLIWSVIHLETGRIRGRRRIYERMHNPRMFAFHMVFKTVIPALCGLAIGLFYTFVYPV